MTRLPSLENLSFVELMLEWAMGSSRLATHTTVKTGILLNHMPRYQLELELVALWDLLMVVVAGWKKPSANLPFVETSLSPTASTWPSVRVSPAGADEEQRGVCERRSPSTNM
ncbi:hypothetical protein VPH35_012274 [Triticum aestivum]